MLPIAYVQNKLKTFYKKCKKKCLFALVSLFLCQVHNAVKQAAFLYRPIYH